MREWTFCTPAKRNYSGSIPDFASEGSCATLTVMADFLNRNPDWATSLDAADDVRKRNQSQRDKILSRYSLAGDSGLTAEEAGSWADLLSSCYWKRCSELRQRGLIVPTGEKRLATSGSYQMVCKVAS